jgi:outer membrane biosynthesis protein TonB
VKQKIKHASVQKEVESIKSRQALLEERKRAERTLRQSRENASSAAREAVDMLRKSIQTSAVVGQSGQNTGSATQQEASSTAAGPVGAGNNVDETMKQYYAAVFQRIQAHWFLPPLQDWDENLEAVLVIKVDRNGKITKSFFEKKSNNLYFNQFLNKTVHDSAPLPSFPKELDASSLEIGLRFTPSGIY